MIGAAQAAASSGSIYFGANLTYNNACVVVVGGPGTMTPNADATQLSSKNAGGQQGTADVYSIWRYEVSVSSPGFFSPGPSGGSDNVAFDTRFSGESIYRGRNFAERSGDRPVRLRNGYSITRLYIDLEATRPDPFPSGNYTATTIVRCE